MRLRTLLFAAMLLLVPVQGMAGSLAHLLCDPGGQMHEMYSNGGHEHGSPRGGDHDNAGGNPVWHAFHGAVLGPVFAMSPIAAPDAFFRAHTPDILYDPFVPELPQRPPLV